jgi:PAS domain S-box-containing protein
MMARGLRVGDKYDLGRVMSQVAGVMAANEGQYRLLVEAVTDYAIYMLSPDGIVVSWNAGARHFKGYAPEEIIGHHFSRFYTPEDRATNLPARALNIAETRGKFENEGWRVRKDGTRFWAHVTIDPIWNPDTGKIEGFAKITRDLTERRAAEEELRKSQELFRMLVQGVTDYAIYMLDTEGKVSSWNAGAERIKGYKPNEIIGQHFSKFYTQEDLDRDQPAIALATAVREGRFEKEGLRVRKDGTKFFASVIIDPIKDDSGKIIGFAKITRDITERMENAETLERTREALFQSQKMEAIGQLTGGVAHDFNNLLMAVLGSLDIVRRRMVDDPRMKTLIDNAIKGAQRGVTLTQRMLAFARRQDLELKPVHIPTLVRGMADLMQRSLGSSVILNIEIDDELPKVVADENQLELAILNLAMNGRDAMPGGGTITIKAEECEVPGYTDKRFVCLSVTDTGEGMDEETLAKAKEPFFTTKGVGKGTGLGLSMVHGVAEQSGGRLELHSKKGEGTTAELMLPISADQSEEGAVTARKKSVVKTKSLTVLAVDDDPLVLVNTVAMLEDLGHKVFAANSGADALKIFDAEKVKLVVTDQAMPLMTGTQLSETLRTKVAKLPIILATGYAELEQGVGISVHRLSKPFTQDELAKAIETVTR